MSQSSKRGSETSLGNVPRCDRPHEADTEAWEIRKLLALGRGYLTGRLQLQFGENQVPELIDERVARI